MEELFRAFFATKKLATDPNLRCGVGRGKKGGWAVQHGHVSLVRVPKRHFTFSRQLGEHVFCATHECGLH